MALRRRHYRPLASRSSTSPSGQGRAPADEVAPAQFGQCVHQTRLLSQPPLVGRDDCLVGHRASSSPSSVDNSHPAPAVRSSTRFSGLPLRLWEIFRAISSKKPARSIRDRAARQCRALQASATACLCDHPIDCLHHNLDLVLTGPTCTQISPSLFRPSPAAASRPARALPARPRRPRWRRLW